jgi:glycogen operon protein
MLCFGMLLDGRVSTSSLQAKGTESTLLIVFNAYHDLVEFSLPAPVENAKWARLVDTNLEADAEVARFDGGSSYGVTGRSVVLFALGA